VGRKGDQALRETLATLKRLCEMMQTWQQPSSCFQILMMLTPFIILLSTARSKKAPRLLPPLLESIQLKTEILPNFTKQF